MSVSNNFIMVIETSNYLNRLEANQFSLFTQKLHNSFLKSINHFKGRILVSNNNIYVVRFMKATNAVLCALKIQSNFKYITPRFDASIRQLRIGIASGNKDDLGQATTLATRICEVIKGQIVITSDVKSEYEQVNKNSFINKEHIRTLKTAEEIFINEIMDFSETIWKKNDFNVNDYSKELPYSKIQVYRKLKSLTGKSPSKFLRDFRLNKALNLLHEDQGNVTEIAEETGFNSLTYFSKCFKSKFGILPSKYSLQHVK